MELTKLSKKELLVKCDEMGITKCKSKGKEELIKLITPTEKKNETKRSYDLYIL